MDRDDIASLGLVKLFKKYAHALTQNIFVSNETVHSKPVSYWLSAAISPPFTEEPHIAVIGT